MGNSLPGNSLPVPAHRHDVVTHEKGEEDGELNCAACGNEIPGQISFWCDHCQSHFHQACAKLEERPSLFFHTCRVTLYNDRDLTCNSCLLDITKGYTYRCTKCNFSMCVECALAALSLAVCDGESAEERILHLCHPHPLKPLFIEPNSLLSCQICHIPCSSSTPTWGCGSCNFHLHKPCLDFIPEMVELEEESWGLQTFPYQKCTDCDKSIHSNLLFHIVKERNYTCLCISCCIVRRLEYESSSQVPKVINHLIHPCPDLKLILSPSSTCNACFLKQHHLFYHCNTCDFYLCFDCAQLPHFCHWHPLKILRNIEDTIDNHICHLCERFCSDSFYSCTIDLCQFYVHKSCIDALPYKMTHVLLNKPIVLLHVPSFECTTCNRLCSGLTFYCSELQYKFCVKCILWPENVLNDDGRFTCVLHWHRLSLCETRIEDKRRRCFLCKEFCIAWSLCYKCSECGLFFHISCAESPRELEHPSHPDHRLALTNRSSSLSNEDETSSLSNEDETCGLCLKSFSRDFPLCDLVYRCQECDFQLDTQCATFLPSVEYEGHPHLLYVVVNMYGNRGCEKCNKSCDGSSTIHCTEWRCDFNLHLQCSLLPLMVEHVCHVHPLILKEYYVEDNGSDVFACHICEDERDPRLRVYCCSQGCLMICDVKCVLNEVLPLLRGEHGEVELRTPFPQVSCRVVNNHSNWEQLLLSSSSESDEIRDGAQNTNQVFSFDEFLGSFPELDEDTSGVETSNEELTAEEDESEEEKSSDGETETSSVSEDYSRGIGTSSEMEVQRYSFSWKALSHFTELLHTPPFDLHLSYLRRCYDGSIVTGTYALPEEFGPIYEEFFGMYNIIDNKCSLNYVRMQHLVFITCYVLYEMRMIKVVDVEKKKMKEWFGWFRFVEERGIFNVGILAGNIKQLWQAHYYIQSRQIVEDKTLQLERELEQVSMYEAELRTQMDEIWIKMRKAKTRHQKLQLKEKEHETYRVVGSRGPMKKARSDALEIKWRNCFDAAVTSRGNFPSK